MKNRITALEAGIAAIMIIFGLSCAIVYALHIIWTSL